MQALLKENKQKTNRRSAYGLASTFNFTAPPKPCLARSEQQPEPAAGRGPLRPAEEFLVVIWAFLLPRAGLTWPDRQDKDSSPTRAHFLQQHCTALHALCCLLSPLGESRIRMQPQMKSTGLSIIGLSKGFYFSNRETKKFY